MTGPSPAVAAVRVAVRAVLEPLAPGTRVLVACSGGADSLALAAAAAFEGVKNALAVGAVVVDHGLQDGSASVAQRAAEQCRSLGLDPVDVVAVEVAARGDGPEAAARSARYAALEASAEAAGAPLVLLGHTRDDQAEQVLLGLARGSGARSLAGMPPRRGRFARPLLCVGRAETAAACAADGLAPWEDPHNTDPAYARVRARSALRHLDAELGPGIAEALARTADQLREDADHLDELARRAAAALGPGPWPVTGLLDLPRPIRTRVWRVLARAAGSPPGSLGARHVEACDALLTRWHGQGPTSLPGGLLAARTGGRVSITVGTPLE